MRPAGPVSPKQPCHRPTRRWPLVPLLLAVVATSSWTIAAEQVSTDEPVPNDTGILQLDLPPGATVTIDGRDYGTRRRLVYRPLEPGKRYGTTLDIRLPDGSRSQRRVFIEGGRVIRVNFAPPARSLQPPSHAGPELVLQTGHARSVQCAALTLDGRHLATGGYDGTLILWDVATGHKLRSFESRDEITDGHVRNIQAVAFSPDGKLLLSGANDATAVLWDKTTGAELRTFPAEERHYQIHSVAFSPDGGKVLTGTGRGVTLWDTASGSRLQALRANSDSSLQTAAFSPSGAHIVTGDDKGIATLWSATTGKVVRTFKQAPANAAGFSMESLTQALGASVPGAAAGDMEESLRESLLSPRIRAVAFNSDDTRLATAVSDGRVTLWDARTGAVLRTLERKASGAAKSVAFSRDGRRLVCCSDLDTTLWDVATGNKLQASASPTASVTFGPDGARMLAGHQDGTVSLWDTDGMKRLWSVSAARGQVHVVAFDPGGKEFATASMMDPTVAFWDVATGNELRRVRVPPMMTNVPPLMANLMRSQGTNYDNMGGAMFAAYGAGGRRLVTASMHVDMGHVFDSLQSAKPTAETKPQERPRQTLKLIAWDVATGEEVWSVDTGMYASFLSGTFALSPDRRMLLSGGPSRTVVWDVETGQEVYRLPGRNSPNPLQGTAFSPNGRHLLVCSGGASASLLDLKTGEEIGKFTGRGGYVYCVAFSPNGEKALTGSTDKTAILWDAATGEKLHELQGHDDAILFMAFSPDGERLLMSGKNSSTLWDTAMGDLLHTLPGGLGSVPQLSDCFTPDSRLVLTRSMDGKCNVWDVETGKSLYDSRGLTGGPICSALSSRGEPLVVGRLLQGGMAITDAVSGDVLGTIREHSASVSSLSVALGTGEMLASVGWGQGLVLWDAALERNAPLKLGDTLFGSSSHATISPDGRRALNVQHGGAATVWDTRSGKKLLSLERLDRDVRCVAFSPDGRQVITGMDDKDAILWDVATGTMLHTLQTQRQVDAVAFSPGDDHVLTNGSYEAAILWNTTTGQKVRELPHEYPSSIAFAPNAERAAVAGDETIAVWDVANNRRLRSLNTHDGTQSLAFGPDAQTILAGHDDGSVTLWNASTGEKRMDFRGHTSDVTSATLKSEGTLLVTGSDDDTIRLWDTSTGAELARLVHLDDGKDWLAVTPDGLFDGSAGGRENVMFRFGGGLNVVPVDRFFQDFYYPGLLAAITRGERPKPKVELAASLPPRVRIVSPARGGVLEANRVTLEVEVVDAGGGVRGPWLVQNGARVLVRGETRREENLVQRTFDVALVEGENKLEVRAASADGSWESEPAVITFRYEKPLPKAELYLVAVGIDRYRDESIGLEFAGSDAASMAQLFEERGPDLYRQVHVTTLLDDEATSPAILGGIRQLAQAALPQDTLVVFLSGHAAVVQEQYYFLPHEFERQADALEEDVRRQGLLATKIGEALVAVPALKRIVVFDTGRSGSQVALSRTARSPFAFRGAVERLSRAQGAFTIAAAAVSEKAGEVPELGHGVLTYTLLAGLHAAEGGPLEDRWIQPAGRDRVAHVLQWFGFASSHVPRLTRQYFGQQQDVQHSSAGMSFPVLPVPASAEAPQVATRHQTTPRRKPESLPAVSGAGHSNLYLVAVGASRYADEAMNLKFARDDATAMVELFRRLGVTAYGQVHAKAVLDDEATRSGILAALETVSRQARPEDTLAVFLAGHGRMVGQRYYFIPREFRRQADSLEEDVREQGLAADVLADAVSKVPARKRLLIFDTCASGGALAISRQGGDPFAFRGAIEQLGRGQGIFTIAASGAGQEAQEVPELGHGVLTYSLLAGLGAVPEAGPLEGLVIHPTSPDGRADVLEWFSYASGHVPRLTRRYLGREQDVQIGGQGASFPLLPLGK